jgi:LemA protein
VPAWRSGQQQAQPQPWSDWELAHDDALPAASQGERARRPRVPFAGAALVAGLLAIGAGLWLIAATGGPPQIQDVASDLNQVGAMGEMNGGLKGLINLMLVSVPLIIPLLWLAWLYNDIVGKEEQVFAAWAQVESSYQRRSDLLPNLVRTVTRYLEHERGTLIDVTQERSAALGSLRATMDEVEAAQKQAEEHAEAAPDTEAAMERLAAAQAAVDHSLGRFFALAENYPDLRAADQFLELQAQLEGTENRLNVARVQFNQRVEEFNGAIRQLPGSLLAKLGDFRRKAYFQAAEGAAAATEVRFD